MPKRNSTVKIVDGKVALSDEVLNIIESWRTEENSEWVDKYLEIISDPSNIGSKKSRGHHIIPCFVFKDEEHKMRIETEKLANSIKGNIIELSPYNHIFAHFYLWKIFNNAESKRPIQKMCNQTKSIENLTECELKNIALLIEECTKDNQTKEERKEYEKRYYREHINEILKYREGRKEIQKEYMKIWIEENKEKQSKKRKENYQNNKEKVSQQHRKYYNNNKEERLKVNKIYRESHSDEIKNYRNQCCYDFIKENYCTLSALSNRKSRNKELYKNIIPSDWIINNKSIS